MQIAFHIGANCTDEDRLLKSVLKNADTLMRQGVAVPGPGKYRRLIRETVQRLDGAAPSADTREIILDAIIEGDQIDRVVMSNDNFVSIPKRIFDHGLFYPQAEGKVRGLHQIFAGDEISLFLALRNPASFLQEASQRAEAGSLTTYLGLLTPDDLRWSDVIARIKRAAPQTPLYVWCNEDTPLIWEVLIRRFSGISDDKQLAGEFDLLSELITDEGRAELAARINADGPQDYLIRQGIIADVLEGFAKPDQLENAIDLPELDGDTVAALTAAYEADLDLIDQMEGVELILPFD